MAVLSNWESFSVIKMAPYPSVFLMNINWHFLNFWEKNGQYQTGYTGNIKTSIFFDFLYKTGIFKTGIIFDFLKKQAFSKRAFFEKNEKRAYPKRPFFENLISKRAFFRFPNGEKKTYARGAAVGLLFQLCIFLWC